MSKILKPEVKSVGMMDTFEMAILKTLSEKALTPVIGNSSTTSGIAKLIGGGIIPSISRNKHANLLSSAMIIDGVEDVAHSMLGKYLGGVPGSADQW